MEWDNAVATERIQRLTREITERLEAVLDKPVRPRARRKIDLREERPVGRMPSERASS